MRIAPDGRALVPLDAHRIASKLYQGSQPPTGPTVAQDFGMLVLAAKEYQPPARFFPGVEVIHAGIDDSGPPITEYEARVAAAAARRVAQAMWDQRRVLVTCYMGINRSGLISALALYFATGGLMSGRACGEQVRRNRPGSLTNDSFRALLDSLPVQRRPVVGFPVDGLPMRRRKAR